MTDLQSLLSELSANAKERNVKFIKDLTLNGKNMGKIGSFVIFTDENPFSVRETNHEKTTLHVGDSLHVGNNIILLVPTE